VEKRITTHLVIVFALLFESTLALVVSVPLQLPDLLWVGPLVHEVLLPLYYTVIPSPVPLWVARNLLSPSLLDEPQLLQYVDVVPLEAVVAAGALPLPRLLELSTDLLGVSIAVLEEVVADEEGRGIPEGRGP